MPVHKKDLHCNSGRTLQDPKLNMSLLIKLYTKMSKRKSSSDPTGNPLSLVLDEEQIAALELIPDGLHPSLKCLVPVLDSIRKACNDMTPTHRKALLVINIILHDQKTV